LFLESTLLRIKIAAPFSEINGSLTPKRLPIIAQSLHGFATAKKSGKNHFS
jgi:hypothetical protein